MEGHTEAWDSLTPTQGATPKRGSPKPQLKGPHQSVESVHHRPKAVNILLAKACSPPHGCGKRPNKGTTKFLLTMLMLPPPCFHQTTRPSMTYPPPIEVDEVT